jgi:hypothetical protein
LARFSQLYSFLFSILNPAGSALVDAQVPNFGGYLDIGINNRIDIDIDIVALQFEIDLLLSISDFQMANN